MLIEVCGAEGTSGPHPFPTKGGQWDFATSCDARPLQAGAVYRRFNVAMAWVRKVANPVFAALTTFKDGEFVLPSGTSEDEMKNMVLVNIVRSSDKKAEEAQLVDLDEGEVDVAVADGVGDGTEQSPTTELWLSDYR